jgi:hypothetical protein
MNIKHKKLKVKNAVLTDWMENIKEIVIPTVALSFKFGIKLTLPWYLKAE